MRKTSYVVTFAAVLIVLVVVSTLRSPLVPPVIHPLFKNILSARLPDWLITTYELDLPNTTTTIRYGLMQRCERSVVSIPGPGNGRLEYSDFQCRPFPLKVQDGCEKENHLACVKWVSARYFTELGIGFASMALAALLIGVSTHSRRRRVWRAVAGLVLLHAIFQLGAFILMTELYSKNAFDAFEHAKPGKAFSYKRHVWYSPLAGLGYVFNAVSWVVGFLVGSAVLVTGIAADRGYKWAAGNRAYQPIRG
ncbi:hypothetical protein JVT61DRAFT_7726 [Boletus reticuloceps]|uniref:Uncharacterized protein n=1 Tax=Boletus reticuloceps TaxID=495285 RepID=A0A8I3A5U1_9AGAM|nr:hypothetical protein JVT61DRAFT_7726 [Boletus reticuloceps]